MMTVLKNKYNLAFLALFIISISFCLNPQGVSAKQIQLNKNQVTTVYQTDNIRRRTQGGVVTEKYYVYSDWSWAADAGPGIIHFINRSNGKQAFQIKSSKFHHMNSLDHKWGSDYVYVHDSIDRCIQISAKKIVPLKNCPKKTSRRFNNVSGTPQAQAPYFNGYYFQGSNNGAGSAITVFNSKRKKQAVFQIPAKLIGCSYKELEAVMVDKGTGDIFVPFNCERGSGKNKVRYMKILKIKASAFGKYTKINSTSTPSTPTPSTPTPTPSTPSTPSTPTPAPTGPKTAILNITSIDGILGLIIDILVIGIPILGIIGITIVGIQYLTAGGNEEKTRKAKRRMFEIVIGLVAYALIFAVSQWLGVGN